MEPDVVAVDREAARRVDELASHRSRVRALSAPGSCSRRSPSPVARSSISGIHPPRGRRWPGPRAGAPGGGPDARRPEKV